MASTSNHQIPSSSTSPPTLWDVFLSFRGTDTRYTFTDFLYKALNRTGIRTFKDNPELRSGEVISDSLIRAIQDSKIYIVVLSENYASSPWCLDELVEILDCNRQLKRIVVPVFYNIDPYVVRHQIGRFKEAFEKHQTRFEMVKVNQWRLALNRVADFSGYHISQNRSQADIIDEVVDGVLLEINPRTLDVAKYPVGLNSHVRGITALFKSDTEGITRIGIHGMGGVGKTTLAKAVYNQNYQRFDGSCFLANVSEASRTEKGLICLQQQLILDILKCNNINIGNVDQGIELIRARICSRKVLIVIDDLDNPKPLQFLEGSFAMGSIIIMTTRNEDLLDSIKVKAKYKVNELDDDQSRQLFAQHAFGENKISERFTELSKDILTRAAGLPLALTVFGSNLLNQSEEEWRWFINKLNRVPIDDIEKKLLISFDALKLIDPMLQNIFLDIACFFIGGEIEEVVRIMETYYTFVNRNIDILRKRCLLTISDDDKLEMHDLLREMGKEIARNNLHDEPGKHSRLWVSKDIYTVLKNHKGTETIQGIIWSNLHREFVPYDESFPAETFKMMSKLRFLFLNTVNLTGSFKDTFEDLRWFCWANCPLKYLPSDFQPQKLVALELPYSGMRTMWELNMVSHVFENLKILNMSDSRNLITTPDFTRLPCLETLNFEFCDSLEKVHVSIGSLVRLVCFDLKGCKSLRSLPDSICRLRALKVLEISSCSRLQALPTEFGRIESLKEFWACRKSVSKLPDSFGCLSNLVQLKLSGNNDLVTLSGSIGNLRSLQILDVSRCEKLEKLPDQLGMITSLRELNVCNASMLKVLPEICRLSIIQHLDLGGCWNLLSIAELPPNLKRLEAKDCKSLKKLPNLSYVKQLEVLVVGSTEIIGLEELPPNLKKIELTDCTSLERLPNLSNLKRLERLDLTGCSHLKEIIGLEELASLRQLSLAGCSSSLGASTLTNSFFQILSGFGHSIEIGLLPDGIGQSSGRVSRSFLDLPPDKSHNLLAIGFITSGVSGNYGVEYSIKNLTGGSIWKDYIRGRGGSVVIVPSSILSIKESDNRIEITSERNIICGVHLLYKTEVTMMGDYDSTHVNVEDERSNPLSNDFESSNWLFLAATLSMQKKKKEATLLNA